MSDSQPTIVGGRYQLGELLGRGGMAEVRKGIDTRLGRTVAVKRLRTDLASDSTFQVRFRREAQASAALNHPSIVAVYDTGEELSSDGSDVAQPYIVMEYVEGRTLRDVLREGRKILPERALEITSGVLAALDYSHRAGIIHRDIKPGNVMLTPSGDVKVMDFGIARAMSDAANTMTQTAAVVGTAQYLSPEQARGETVDSRSDVYSAGCLMYELLTGRPPFVGETPVSVAYQHVREHARRPSELDAELDASMDAIVMKALAKPVEERYQSAAAMRNDIERLLAGQQVQVAPAPPPPPVAAPAPVAPAPAPAPEPEWEDEPERTSKLLIAFITVVAVALIAAAVVLLPKMFNNEPTKEQVPDLAGLAEDDARLLLRDHQFPNMITEREASTTVDKGQVIRQDPQPNDYAVPSATVTVWISTGPPQTVVPVVRDLSREEAIAELKKAGLKARVERIISETVGTGDQVIRTSPTGNQVVRKGSTVTLFVTEAWAKVPNVVSMRRKAAIRAIEDAGFIPVPMSCAPDSVKPKGEIVSQNPLADTPRPPDTQITLCVSDFVKPTPTPTPSETATESPSGSPSGEPTGTPDASPTDIITDADGDGLPDLPDGF